MIFHNKAEAQIVATVVIVEAWKRAKNYADNYAPKEENLPKFIIKLPKRPKVNVEDLPEELWSPEKREAVKKAKESELNLFKISQQEV